MTLIPHYTKLRVLSDSTDATVETSIGAFSSGLSSNTISFLEASRVFSIMGFDLGGKSTRVPSAAIPQALKQRSEINDDKIREKLTPQFGPSNFQNQK